MKVCGFAGRHGWRSPNRGFLFVGQARGQKGTDRGYQPSSCVLEWPQMTTRFIVGIVALGCVSVCGLVATIANFEMMEMVNEKLPKGEQFAVLGWYFSKRQRLHREYERLFPDGHLLLRVRVATALMFACLLICAWGLGFFAWW